MQFYSVYEQRRNIPTVCIKLLIPQQLCSLQIFPITFAAQVVELQKDSWFSGENQIKLILRSLKNFLNIIQRKIRGAKSKRKNNTIKKMKVNRERRKETDMKK